MRVLLAMIARRYGEPHLDDVLEVMSPSFDGLEVRYDEGEGIADFAAARNALIEAGRRQRYDWIFMLDADECLFPDDVTRLRTLMTGDADFIVLPRVNLAKDMRHFAPAFYPDLQGRAFRLDAGYRYRGAVHEQLYKTRSTTAALAGGRYVISRATPIYHYGLTRSTDTVLLKAMNYDRIAVGKPLIAELPEDIDPAYVRDLLRPIGDDRLMELDIPHPLGLRDASHESGWAGYYVCPPLIEQEAGHVHEHAELLSMVTASAGHVLEVGAGTGALSRYLAQRGASVTATDADTIIAARLARRAEALPCLQTAAGSASATPELFGTDTFGVAFSEGLFQHLGDEQALQALEAQLSAAPRVLISVPLGAPFGPAEVYGGERVRSIEEWQRLLGQAGAVRVLPYGRRYLPLRQAVAAKLRRRLVQHDTHVAFEVLRG